MKRFLILSLLILIATIAVKPQSAFRLFVLHKYAEPLYRKPSKKELKTVEVDRDLIEKYRSFLRQRNTGLTKLVADRGCAKNTKVISASENCLKYTMPGGGSSFSFRTRSYRISRLADITFTQNSFQAMGALLNGFFVKLGDIPVERVNLETDGLEFLSKFNAPNRYRSAKKADEILSVGFLYKGFLHRRALYIKTNTTFALRSIAYRGKLYRSIAGITYNELDFDKRRDIIVVFRIVRLEKGMVTILWKELLKKKPPKLRSGE